MIYFRTYIILAVSLAFTGCNVSSHPEESSTVNFSIFETTKANPKKVEDKKPIFSKEKADQFASIMDGFTKNASARFGDPELAKHIDRIEAIYIESGRYLELTQLYEAEYKKEGIKGKMVKRLIFAYIRLGQDKSARDLLDELSASDSQSADFHFLEGSFWMRQPRTVPNLTKALNAWTKVLELEPNYLGFEGIDSTNIQTIIDRLQGVVPKSALAATEDETGMMKKDTPKTGDSESDKAAEKNSSKAEDKKANEKVVVKTKEAEIAEKVEAKVVEKEEPIITGESQRSQADLDSPTLQPNATRSSEEAYKINIAMAEIAVSEGKFDKGDRFFAAAKAIKPDGFEAEFGPLRAKWRFEPARNKVSVAVRKLAKKKLNAKQTYQVALFVYSNMGVNKLARELFQSVKTQDPVFAEKVGLDRLLEQVK